MTLALARKIFSHRVDGCHARAGLGSMSLKPIAERILEEEAGPERALARAWRRGFLAGLVLALVVAGGAVGAGRADLGNRLRALLFAVPDKAAETGAGNPSWNRSTHDIKARQTAWGNRTLPSFVARDTGKGSSTA